MYSTQVQIGRTRCGCGLSTAALAWDVFDFVKIHFLFRILKIEYISPGFYVQAMWKICFFTSILRLDSEARFCV